jgi:hypothetical protein
MVCPPKLGRPWSPLWGNFSRSLRIRWPRLEWKKPKKDLGTVGLGNLCMQEDMDLLYAATKISLEIEKCRVFGKLLGWTVRSQNILLPSY